MPILLSLLLLFISCGFVFPGDNVHMGNSHIADGMLSDSSVVYLRGQWEYYPDKFISPSDNFSKYKTYYLDVPGKWNDCCEVNPKYGTYRVKIMNLPDHSRNYSIKMRNVNSAYKIWINNNFLGSHGNVADQKDKEIPSAGYQIHNFITEQNSLEIVIHVSNYTNIAGGMLQSPILGYTPAVYSRTEYSIIVSVFLVACFLLISFIYIINYRILKTDKHYLYFGLFSAMIALRVLFKGEKMFYHYFPSLPWWFSIRVEYISFYAAAMTLAFYIYTLYYKDFSDNLMYFIKMISWLILTQLVFLPFSIYISMHNFYTIVSIFLAAYIIYVLLIAMKNKRLYSGIVLSGYIILFCGFFIDRVFWNYFGMQYSNFSAIGVFSLLISQTLMGSLQQNRNMMISKKLSLDLSKMNLALQRFVPHEFIDYLNKNDISEVKLGDQVQKKMSVLFADIRKFTELSETISPQENFNFLNSYLKRVGPEITRNNGFIDKYIGDEIMALFPGSCDDAVVAGINIQKEVLLYNKHRAKMNYPSIKVGIGIHFGELMLGTIGEENRMESTVISDAVNLTSRLEGLNKVFGSSILISDDVFFNLQNPNDYNIRFLGRVQVKGKQKSVAIYEILDGLDSELIEIRNSTKGDFEQGIVHYFQKDFKKAVSFFSRVISIDPLDSAAKFYFSECNLCKMKKIPDDWEGVIEMEKRKIW